MAAPTTLWSVISSTQASFMLMCNSLSIADCLSHIPVPFSTDLSMRGSWRGSPPPRIGVSFGSSPGFLLLHYCTQRYLFKKGSTLASKVRVVMHEAGVVSLPMCFGCHVSMRFNMASETRSLLITYSIVCNWVLPSV